MSALAWLLIGVAFLILVMVANNSWTVIWSRLTGGAIPVGSGNPIVPTPGADAPQIGGSGAFPVAPTPSADNPDVPQGNFIVPVPTDPGTFTP